MKYMKHRRAVFLSFLPNIVSDTETTKEKKNMLALCVWFHVVLMTRGKLVSVRELRSDKNSTGRS